MNIPKLIKAGDLSLGLGKSMTPSKVDCRVITEDLYQEIIDIIAEIRTNDIDNYMNCKDNLMPLKTRKKLIKKKKIKLLSFIHQRKISFFSYTCSKKII